MILCPKCGKVKTYKIRQTVTREIIYLESGWMYDCNDWEFVNGGKGQPRCPRCGRVVKFFKDVEEVEDESKENN